MKLVGFRKTKSNTTFLFDTKDEKPIINRSDAFEDDLNGIRYNYSNYIVYNKKLKEGIVDVKYPPIIELQWDDVTMYGKKLYLYNKGNQVAALTQSVAQKFIKCLMHDDFVKDNNVYTGYFILVKKGTVLTMSPYTKKEWDDVDTIKYGQIIKEEKKSFLISIMKKGKRLA